MYYISVSNGLLENDHQRKMGAAVWQYMWLIDKITKIDNDGVGWVLGGKPVNLKDLAECVAEVTVSRNLQKLKAQNYIILKHTAYGIIIGVLKAKKRFNKNAESHNKSDKPTLSETINLTDKSDKPLDKSDKPNKIVQLDNTVKDSTVRQGDPVYFSNPDVKEIYLYGIEQGFSSVKEQQQCWAITRMLKKYPKEVLLKSVNAALSLLGKPYVVQISDFLDLEQKILKLVAHFKSPQPKGKNYDQ